MEEVVEAGLEELDRCRSGTKEGRLSRSIVMSLENPLLTEGSPLTADASRAGTVSLLKKGKRKKPSFPIFNLHTFHLHVNLHIYITIPINIYI